MFNMINVENSSNIKSFGYQEGVSEFEGKLRIEFLHGVSYEYWHFPKRLFEKMCKEESKGSFFHRKIKGKFFEIKVK